MFAVFNYCLIDFYQGELINNLFTFTKKMNKKKGEISLNWIIENCIEIFNSQGLDITLNQLALELNISRGRINHYFPTKDHLFVAIAQKYEEKLAAIRDNFNYSTEENFLFDQIKLYSVIMDNQYHL